MPDPSDDGVAEALRSPGPERNTMAMSYAVTVVNFFATGDPKIDVIDSRSGRYQLAAIGKELEIDGRDVACRLIVTEDLPRATYEMLEHDIGVGPRLLDDHRQNGHGPDFIGRADFDIAKAPRSSAISIAIPFDLQIGADVFPSIDSQHEIAAVTKDIIGILNHHQLVNYLRYNWEWLLVDTPLPALFFRTYRRISIEFLPGPYPTVVILLYPPLWNLQEFQRTYQFHTPNDLLFHHPTSTTMRKEREPLHRLPRDGFIAPHFAERTWQLINYLQGGGSPLSAINAKLLKDQTSTWLILNAYTAFEASAESNIRRWHSLKCHISAAPTKYLQNKDLCEQLQKLAAIKTRQMDKAYTELTTVSDATTESVTPLLPDSAFGKYALQQWQRSRRSMQWILDDLDRILRINESRLQVDLTMTQMQQSRSAIQEAKTVKRLTSLAFIFIPISTVCSAFGMNVRELSQDLPPIWLSITIALVVAFATLICSTEFAGNIFWATLSLVDSSLEVWRNWWQDVYDNTFTEEASFGWGVATIGANFAGVKPYQDPRVKRSMRSSLVQRIPMRVLALIALAPLHVQKFLHIRLQRLEARGRAFRHARPP